MVSNEDLSRIQGQRLEQPLNLSANLTSLRKLDPALFNERGMVEVLIRLKGDPAALADVENPGAGSGAKARIMVDQQNFVSRGRYKARSMRVTGSTQVAINAVFAEVDTSDLLALAQDADVERVTLVRHYEMDLAETVPQIGAAAAQAVGVDGTGVKVAVLDSGIDYTHVAFGGAGTPEAYAAAYGPADGSGPETTTRDGLFPTAKVVEGFDFVGELWPLGERAEDDDPIAGSDIFSDGGHGTHVADIIGGITPGAPGVAPGVELYAVKVCAVFATSCNGVALIKGIEYAMDPNGDGRTRDRVDIINMSLGSNFGQAFDDDLAYATDIATKAGILTVASAGNGGDYPYITGTPGAATTALSVAQTQVASAVNPNAMQIVEPAALAGNYEAVHQNWSAPLGGIVQGTVTYAEPGNLNGCAPFQNALSGIVLVDRGGCNFTLKIVNIENAGGSLGIIGLVTPEAPFIGGDGGDRPDGGVFTIPGYMIGQDDADILRAGNAVVRFDPDVFYTNFTGRMVNTSSRGPGYFGSDLKPEIGAPGASVSAASATGTGTNAFGGTSGAAPMVAGAAALLMDAYPFRSALEIKAVLMNTGETAIVNSAAGDLAAISRVGGGEVRVDAALAAPVAAWDNANFKGGLAFGQVEVDGSMTLEKRVTIRNYSLKKVKYKASSEFRFANDEASDAVDIQIIPNQITLQPLQSRTVKVRMKIDGQNLPGNFMNDGSGGGDPANLTLNEYDGFVLFEAIEKHSFWNKWFDNLPWGHHRGGKWKWPRWDLFDTSQDIAMPWHVLPRKAAKVEADRTRLKFVNGTDSIVLSNEGVGTAQNDGYSLLYLSDSQPTPGPRGGQNPNPAVRAFGTQTYIAPDGYCDDGDGQVDYLMAFAFNLWERQPLAVWPGLAGIFLDVNGDGAVDYDVYNLPLNFFGVLGDYRNVTVVTDVLTGEGTAFFFTEQATNTANQVLLACHSQFGSPAFFTPIPSTVYVDDAYFGTSSNAAPVTWAPLGERYFADFLPDLPGGQSGAMSVIDFGEAGTNPGELGLMIFTNGDRGAGNRGGATEETEALLFMPKSKK